MTTAPPAPSLLGLDLLKFVLAFCSMAYELLLAQALSAFLENTVLRYSVTIGLYLFSLGMGALCVEEMQTGRALLRLLGIEMGLTVLGGTSLLILHGTYALGGGAGFSWVAHGLILAIGFLTGMEVPLLITIRTDRQPASENRVLAADYAGAMVATFVFAFIFYPVLGLVPSAFCLGALNAAAGLSLWCDRRRVPEEDRGRFRKGLVLCAGLLGLALMALAGSGVIGETLLRIYLGSGP